MKITKKELQSLIKEEAERYVRLDILKTKKESLQEAISKLETTDVLTEEQIEEISFGGLKSAFGKAKEKAGKQVDKIKKGAKDIKQAYDAGAEKEKMEKAQQKVAQIAKKINMLKKKMEADKKELQKQYAELTGGKIYKGGAIHKPVLSEGEIKWVL
jgi:hypothetical protein